MDDKSFVSHLAVIRKAEWNPGEGVSVRVICNLIHTVQHKDHWLAAGGFLHQVLAIKDKNMLINNKSKIKVALYDYDPVEQSPNLDSHLELSFLAGDVLHICE